MECKEANKMAKALIDRTLSWNKKRELFYHVKQCKSCHDDLSKEYMLYSMLKEKDNDQKIYDDFDKVMNKFEIKINRDKFSRHLVNIADTLIIWAVTISIIVTIALAWKY